MRILLIDGHPLFMDALAVALRRAWPDAEVMFAHSISEGLERVRSEAADVVMANVETLGETWSHIPRLVAAAAPAPVIATVNAIQGQTVARLIAAGVRGCLPKTMSGEGICGALAFALSGGICLPSQGAIGIVDSRPNHVRSRREFEILAHLARGASNKVIARELGLSVATVKLHVQSILRSTGARNRVEAIANARRLGMLPANS